MLEGLTTSAKNFWSVGSACLLLRNFFAATLRADGHQEGAVGIYLVSRDGCRICAYDQRPLADDRAADLPSPSVGHRCAWSNTVVCLLSEVSRCPDWLSQASLKE